MAIKTAIPKAIDIANIEISGNNEKTHDMQPTKTKMNVPRNSATQYFNLVEIVSSLRSLMYSEIKEQMDWLQVVAKIIK